LVEKLKISIDSSEINKMISMIEGMTEKNAMFAASLGINRTAQIVKQEIINSIPETFRMPSAYTRNSIMMQPSSKTNLTAIVRFKDGTAAKHYLEPQVYGGTRALKRSESLLIASGAMPSGSVWIPGKGARRDGLGMSRTQMLQILAGLQSMHDEYKNSSARSRKRGKRRNDYYFAIKNSSSHLIPGVYHVQSGHTIPLLRYVATPSYKKLWDYWGIANKTTKDNLDKEMSKAILFAMATRR
jgi:hypothetical protein